MSDIILETPRLFLRKWQEKDRVSFAGLNADPEVMRYMGSLLTRAQSDSLIDSLMVLINQDGIGFWALERKDDGAFIGFTGLAPVEPGKLPCAPAVEAGWRLARPFWGRGYATEAARASLAHGFGILGLNEIVAFTAVHNNRSRAVMERLGMHHDPADDFDHPALVEGHPLRRHVLYRKSRSS